MPFGRPVRTEKPPKRTPLKPLVEMSSIPSFHMDANEFPLEKVYFPFSPLFKDTICIWQHSIMPLSKNTANETNSQCPPSGQSHHLKEIHLFTWCRSLSFDVSWHFCGPPIAANPQHLSPRCPPRGGESELSGLSSRIEKREGHRREVLGVEPESTVHIWGSCLKDGLPGTTKYLTYWRTLFCTIHSRAG